MPLEKATHSPDGDDRALVQMIVAKGSEEAFRELYGRHSPRIYRVLLRMLTAESDAEDVLQETWLRAVPRLFEFEWRASLNTWLTAIAVNIARDLLDKRGRWLDIDLEERMLVADGVESIESLDLERALAILPAGCRTVFVLHDIEGYTHEEIAAQLGYTSGTSKSQLFRARRALRRLLNEAEVEESNHAES